VIIAWALGLASVFTFGGGDEYALAKAVHSTMSAPVTVMYSAPPAQFKRISFEYRDLEDFRKKLAVATSSDLKSNAWGFGPRAWPQGFYFKLSSQTRYLEKLPNSKEQAVLSESNGKLTIDSKGSALGLADVAGALPGWSMSWNRFYEEARFAIIARDSRPDEVLEAIGSAIGADVKVDGKDCTFGVEPRAFRSRTVEMCKLPSQSSVEQLRVSEDADLKFLSALVKGISDRQIVKFQTGWEGEVYFNSGHAVHAAALNRARARTFAATPSEDLQVTGADIRPMISSIDPKAKVFAYLRPDGTICCEYVMRDGRRLVF
jgi:hypothetical protein